MSQPANAETGSEYPSPAPAGRFYGNGLLPTLGGFCGLVVVMGIGRFAYTVLLPGMMQTHGFGEDIAGLMAAWNYAGYLAGVLAMRGQTPGMRRYAMLAVFLLLSLATTAGMALAGAPWLWHTMRFFSGFASGACFVLCSSIVFDTLAALNRSVIAGWIYSGTGAGIVLSGVAAGPLVALLGQDGSWGGMAALCLPLTIVTYITLRPGVNRAPERAIPQESAASSAIIGAKIGAEIGAKTGISGKYVLLLAVYFLEGFGYIIGTTFIVAFVQEATGSPEAARTVWIITGLGAVFGTPLWRYAARRGYAPTLILALVLQGLGVLLPVVSHTPAAAMAGGLLLGGTFMGIVAVSLQYAVVLSGRASAHAVATMTGVYGIGQILGPFVVAITAPGQGFSAAFAISAASLFVAAGILFAGRFLKEGSREHRAADR